MLVAFWVTGSRLTLHAAPRSGNVKGLSSSAWCEALRTLVAFIDVCLLCRSPPFSGRRFNQI
jgi:hypothetical protein